MQVPTSYELQSLQFHALHKYTTYNEDQPQSGYYAVISLEGKLQEEIPRIEESTLHALLTLEAIDQLSKKFEGLDVTIIGPHKQLYSGQLSTTPNSRLRILSGPTELLPSNGSPLGLVLNERNIKILTDF